MKEALSEAVASTESLQIPGLDESEEIDRDDFEFISEDELVEAINKWLFCRQIFPESEYFLFCLIFRCDGWNSFCCGEVAIAHCCKLLRELARFEENVNIFLAAKHASLLWKLQPREIDFIQ